MVKAFNMITYGFTNNDEKLEFYCHKCGTKSVGKVDDEVSIQKCNHLVYIGTSESNEFKTDNLLDGFDEDKDDTIDFLNNKLDDTYVCFTSGVGSPSGLEGYIIYNFND